MPCDLCSFLRGSNKNHQKKKSKKKKKKKKDGEDADDEAAEEEEEEQEQKVEVDPPPESVAADSRHSHSHSHSQRLRRPRPILRRSASQAHREFLASTSLASTPCNNLAHLPDLDLAFAFFSRAFPRFSDTSSLDLLRLREYSYLQDTSLSCLDYCGFGLFSGSQIADDEDSRDSDHGSGSGFSASSFALSAEFSANLWSHALFGCSPEGTMEWGLRIRIMDFLSIPESEYSVVFTATRGSTFKLLADAYPWHTCRRLATMYDYESESVVLLEHQAAQRNAKVYRARFRWPSLIVHSSELKRELMIGSSGKKKGLFKAKQQPDASNEPSTSFAPNFPSQKKGLFVFPVQSRVSGSKYSYQWMSVAQQNEWHVLLDASALGPKDMDSLGLSLFRPDFITASFYKLFGWDPSGFSCLIIKNTVAQSIQDSRGILVSGMVHVMPVSPQLPGNDSFSLNSSQKEHIEITHGITAFSGPVPVIDDFKAPRSPIEEVEYDSISDYMEFGSVDSMSPTPAIDIESNISVPLSEVGAGSFILGHRPSAKVDSASFSEDAISGPISPGSQGQGRRKYPNSHAGGMSSPPFTLTQKISGWTKKFKFSRRGNSNSIAQDDFEGHAEDKCSVNIVEQVMPCEDLNDRTSQRSQQKIESDVDESLTVSLNIKPNLLSRDTEGGFRLLEHRNIDPFAASPGDYLAALNSSGSEGHENFLLGENNDVTSEVSECEPQLLCRGLDHADMVGLNKTSFRHRCLVNWLISSLLKLEHPENGSCLVKIYGPHTKYDRGLSVAFNVFDRHGKLHDPNQIRLLADQSNLSLGLGYLRSISVRGETLEIRPRTNASALVTANPSRFEVVTATLGLMTNFQDMYRLWSFIARFLDPDFL